MTKYEWLIQQLQYKERSIECWIWPFSCNTDGYGHLRLKGKLLRLTRLVLEIETGENLSRNYALHSCDNPPCFNPLHLRWGSRSENVQDAIKRNRHVAPGMPGEKNPKAKLTQEDVDNIRQKLELGVSGVSLAKEYSVTPSTISLIKNKRHWK